MRPNIKTELNRSLFVFMVIWCIALSSTGVAQEIQVSDPRLEIRDNRIHITYDILKSTSLDRFMVDLSVTDAKGNAIKAVALSGDIGDMVPGGDNRHIVWDLEADQIKMNASIFVKLHVKVIPPPEPVPVSPGGGEAVAAVFSREPVFGAQPGEDHGLVGAGAEGVAKSVEKHRQGEMNESRAAGKDQKGQDVGHERGDHGAPPTIQIGQRAGRNLEQIGAQFAHRDQQSDLGEIQTLVEKEQHQKRFEVALILQKTVEGKADEHGTTFLPLPGGPIQRPTRKSISIPVSSTAQPASSDAR